MLYVSICIAKCSIILRCWYNVVPTPIMSWFIDHIRDISIDMPTINHDYLSYVHQLIDSELGHHLDRGFGPSHMRNFPILCQAFFYQPAADHFHPPWKASWASWWNVSAFVCAVHEVPTWQTLLGKKIRKRPQPTTESHRKIRVSELFKFAQLNLPEGHCEPVGFWGLWSGAVQAQNTS